MKITVEMLKTKKACQEQVKVFEQTFGLAAEVTLENCLMAAKAGLDFYWAARKLLPAPARAAYEAAIARAFFDASQIEE